MSRIPRFASYRDPQSSIRVDHGRVVRSFSAAGRTAFEAADSSGVLSELVEDGLLVPYEIINHDPFEVASDIIPFVSYPSEWTSGMLREAGLLTLDIARRLWRGGFHLRDASAYNVAFAGTRPVLVDLGSIGEGNTRLWTSYAQFCDHFLNPLLIEAKLGIPFRQLWTLEGVSVSTTRKLLRGRRALFNGAFRNVVLRANLEEKFAGIDASSRLDIRSTFALQPAQVEGVMSKMAHLLGSLDLPTTSEWAGYEDSSSYDDSQETERQSIIAAFAESRRRRRLAVDIGTNTGRHALVLSRHFDIVVAIDADAAAIEQARRRFEAEISASRVYPLVADVANPTPGTGLMNGERLALFDRLGDADAAIWMAIIHHLAIGRSIPFEELARLAASLAGDHLIEFVGPDDPMVELLSASKGGEIHPYTIDTFLDAFKGVFDVTQVGEVRPRRPIFSMTPR